MDLLASTIYRTTKGEVEPWVVPYKEIPNRNYISKQKYNIKNIENRYAFPWWVTERQIKNLRGTLKQDETGYIIWDGKKFIEVYNILQCNGITYSEDKQPSTIAKCDQIVQPYLRAHHIEVKPSLTIPKCYKENKIIYLPQPALFSSIELYHRAKFHEVIHSTQLDFTERECINMKFSTYYYLEEIVADLGAAILADKTGIVHGVFESVLSYINAYVNKSLYSVGLGKSKKNKVQVLEEAYEKAQKSVDKVLMCGILR